MPLKIPPPKVKPQTPKSDAQPRPTRAERNRARPTLSTSEATRRRAKPSTAERRPRPAGAKTPPVRQPRKVKSRVAALPSVSAARKRAGQPLPRDRNSQAYKQQVAKKGVEAVRRKLYRMGFNSVRQVQHNKVHGVDLAAFRYGRSGRLLNAAVAEVKASGSKRLGPNSLKRQTAHRYVERNLFRAATARPKVREADKLYRLAKARKLNIYGGTYLLGERGAKVHKVYEPRPVKQRQRSPLTVRSTK